MYKLIVKPYAEQDISDAAKWYNRKHDGLGAGFLLSVEERINTIQKSPEQHQKTFKSIRRALIERFPFGIFYSVEGNTIYDLAVLHTSRSPKQWKKRALI